MDGNGALTLSVHVAGSDYLTGIALSRLFDQSGFIEVTGVSTCGTEAVSSVRSEHPDVVLVDESIVDRGLTETTSAICGLSAAPKVAILSARTRGGADGTLAAAFAAGASSYIVRDLTAEDIAAALRIVHRGGLVNAVFPACRHAPQTANRSDAHLVSRFGLLSSRDLLIVDALVEGDTNLQMSRKLNVSEATIKARLARIMQLLGVENRVQIAVAAVRAGGSGTC